LYSTLWDSKKYSFIIINAKQDFNVACACAGVHLLVCICYEINQLTTKLIEQKKESNRQLLQSLEAIALDLLAKMK
jgi:hypothetical protein